MSRKKILVVEDNEDNRHILVYRLRKIGDFDILEATHGEEALNIIATNPPDLMFLDLKLPVLDGWETARRIRAMDGPIRNLPIIALTATTLTSAERAALEQSVRTVIQKQGLERDALLQELRGLLHAYSGTVPAG